VSKKSSSLNEMIPFGKYKGQPVSQLACDPQYVQWLLSQPWFKERYGGIQTLIVNNFKGDDGDTPEHNEFQSEFLSLPFAYSVFCASLRGKPFGDWEEALLYDFRDSVEKFSESKSFNRGFEEEGWDVYFQMEYAAWGVLPKEHPELQRKNMEDYTRYDDGSRDIGWGGLCFIEVKPTLAEEFPSVLRQVKARRGRRGKCVVLVKDFLTESVSFESVRRIFSSSGVRLLRCSDIQMIEPPKWLAEAAVKFEEGVE